MTQDDQDHDILLKLTMPGKNLRTNPKDAPQLPDQPKPDAQPPQPPSQPTPTQDTSAQTQPHLQPQRETNTIVPPANTPPPTSEAQDDILRKLTMKPKDYTIASPTIAQVKDIHPPQTHSYQTPEEARSNKPYVSSDSEIERVRKLALNIYGTDLVQKKIQNKSNLLPKKGKGLG